MMALSFHPGGTGNQTQVIRLRGESVYLLSHFVDPREKQGSPNSPQDAWKGLASKALSESSLPWIKVWPDEAFRGVYTLCCPHAKGLQGN